MLIIILNIISIYWLKRLSWHLNIFFPLILWLYELIIKLIVLILIKRIIYLLRSWEYIRFISYWKLILNELLGWLWVTILSTKNRFNCIIFKSKLNILQWIYMYKGFFLQYNILKFLSYRCKNIRILDFMIHLYFLKLIIIFFGSRNFLGIFL